MRGKDLGRCTLKSQGLVSECVDALSEDFRTIRSDIYLVNEISLVYSYVFYVILRNPTVEFFRPASLSNQDFRISAYFPFSDDFLDPPLSLFVFRYLLKFAGIKTPLNGLVRHVLQFVDWNTL